MKKGQTINFKITNLLKPDSLYNHGMQPVTYSDTAASASNVGWVRAGSKIRYYRNARRVESARIERTHYTLTWEYTFAEDKDTVYFAHCYPVCTLATHLCARHSTAVLS